MTSIPKKLFPIVQRLALLIPVTALVLACGFFFIHIVDRVSWSKYYEPVTKIGDRCRYQVATWPGSFEQALTRLDAGAWTPFAMPHRGKDHPPRAFVDQFLATECFLEPMQTTVASRPHVNLGKLYGGSNIYLDRTFVRAVDDGLTGDFEISAERLDRAHVILVLSRGMDDGSVGMATLRPPYVSLNPDQEILIRRFDNAIYIEHPIFRIGLMALLLIVLFVVKKSGFSHSDVTWMLNWSGVLLLANATQYSFQFNTAVQGSLERVFAALNFTSYVCLSGYILSYVLRDLGSALVSRVLVSLSVLYSLGLVLVSDKIFFDLRMMTRLPAMLGAILAGICLVALLYYRKDIVQHSSAVATRRFHFGIIASSAAGIALLGQMYLDEQHGIYIDSILQMSFIGVNFLYLAADMGQRQNEYFIEKRLRVAEQERNQWAKTVADAARFVAHDLQRPFAVLSEFVHQIDHQKGQNIEALIRSFQTAIRDAEAEATALIGDLTQLSPDHVIQRAVLSAGSIVAEAADRTRKLFPGQTLHIDLILRESISGDQRSLVRVMQNIFVNALQAAGPQCVIRVSDTKTTATEYCIEIHNTGSFIPRDTCEKIFDLGFTSGKERGSGLGLAYAAQVLHQCGGRIYCESDAVAGTSFFLAFPRLLPPAKIGAQPVTRIAVVDDDLFVGLSWQRQCAGAKVDHYQSAEAFLAAMKMQQAGNDRYQIAILDLNFENSKYTGIDIARALKQLDQNVIAVLSTAQQMKVEDISNEGCIDLVIAKKATSLIDLQKLIQWNGAVTEKTVNRKS